MAVAGAVCIPPKDRIPSPKMCFTIRLKVIAVFLLSHSALITIAMHSSFLGLAIKFYFFWFSFPK